LCGGRRRPVRLDQRPGHQERDAPGVTGMLWEGRLLILPSQSVKKFVSYRFIEISIWGDNMKWTPKKAICFGVGLIIFGVWWLRKQIIG